MNACVHGLGVCCGGLDKGTGVHCAGISPDEKVKHASLTRRKLRSTEERSLCCGCFGPLLARNGASSVPIPSFATLILSQALQNESGIDHKDTRLVARQVLFARAQCTGIRQP